MKDLDIASYFDDNTLYFAGDYIVGYKIYNRLYQVCKMLLCHYLNGSQIIK